MPAKRSRPTSRGNRQHAVEDIKLNWHQRRSAQAFVAFWRWLLDLIVIGGILIASAVTYYQLTRFRGYDTPGALLPWWAALIVIVSPFLLLAAIPHTRRAIAAIWWFNITRHRLRAFMAENGIRNRSNRLPWLIIIYPTKVGERAWMWLVGGISVSDIESRIESLGPTCYAQDGTVTPHKKWAHLIRLDIKRRDLLHHDTPVKSTLLGNGETELLPPTDLNGTPAVSDWAKEIGLPLEPHHDNGQGNGVPTGKPNATASEPPKARKKTTTNNDEPDRVLSKNGEDLSDWL